MSENIDGIKAFSLTEVALSIQRTLTERYKTAFWVKAEMNKLNHYTHSGHCYPELVEKKNGKVATQLKAVIWKADFERINLHFQRVVNEPLKDGIQILFLASIHFDPMYGLTLRIVDIEPAFSLGELEREKAASIHRLKEEQLFDRNKQLPLALLPRRIAVISVETSKGYADFLKILNENPWGYHYFQMLFPALLQGDKSIPSIIYQLGRIEKVKEHFDVVAIVRGGGGDIGLSSFNNYELSKTIAQFPLPVLSGIGHATNETVAELVSYKSAITPTELADFLLQKFHNVAVTLQKSEASIISISRQILSEQQTALHSFSKLFKAASRNVLLDQKSVLTHISRIVSQQSVLTLRKKMEAVSMCGFKLRSSSISKLTDIRNTLNKSTVAIEKGTGSYLQFQKLHLESLEKNISLLSPEHILKRGFSITQLKGKTISDVTLLQQGDRITTITASGIIESTVDKNPEDEK